MSGFPEGQILTAMEGIGVITFLKQKSNGETKEESDGAESR